MNFKPILLLFVLFTFGCGVKARPASPPETAVQSYVNSFLDKTETQIVPIAPTK